MHWDFRLERGGVLVSWAVPKGVPLDPAANRLAVQTEDHPMSYADFEGDIAEGEYGGGGVAIWDRGTYETEEWTPEKVKVVLHGSRVEGRYVLFRTGGKNWMMHRMSPPPDGYLPLPARVAPMVATLADSLPADDEQWAYEMKWDGVRAVVHVDGGRPTAWSRNDIDITGTYPELRAMAESMGATQAVLDGELVALDPNGRPSFELLQPRMHVSGAARIRRLTVSVPVTYYVFDLLHLDGRSTMSVPYRERRALLEDLNLSGPSWRTPPAWFGGGPAVLAAAREQGLEGVVAKQVESTYQPGARSRSWLKIKNLRTQEVLIAGWRPGQGRRADGIGSLLLAIPTGTGCATRARWAPGSPPPHSRTCSADWSRWPRTIPRWVTTSREQTSAAHAGSGPSSSARSGSPSGHGTGDCGIPRGAACDPTRTRTRSSARPDVHAMRPQPFPATRGRPLYPSRRPIGAHHDLTVDAHSGGVRHVVRTPVAHDRYLHEAFFWRGDDHFLARTVPFVLEGLEAGEPVMAAVAPGHVDLLRDALGGAADEIQLLDMGRLGANPARIIPAWREFTDAHAGPGRPVRGIGEPVWSARRGSELAECQLHEALLNYAVGPGLPCGWSAPTTPTASRITSWPRRAARIRSSWRTCRRRSPPTAGTATSRPCSRPS